MEVGTRMDRRDWPWLGLLSVLWGGTFFFVGLAVKDLSPLAIVFARVSLAGLILAPAVPLYGDKFPTHLRDWTPFFVMGILNNVIPFSLLTFAQTEISSGLASILNATAPIFAISVAVSFGEEVVSVQRAAGVGLGLLGVVILQAGNIASSNGMRSGIALCRGAAASYGFAGLWGRRKLTHVSPLTSAACQLVSAGIVMLLLLAATGSFAAMSMPSSATWASLIGLASLSTALAYVIFFRILARSGSTNVMLVTLLIPITSIPLGHFILHDPVSAQEIIGALVIGSALIVLNGRGLCFVVFWKPS